MSFDSPWRWTDGQFAGFKEGLGDADVEYKIFQMDIKRHASREAQAIRGASAREMIDAWSPDLLYISDDAGIDHVARHYANTPMPIVFSGANKTLAEHSLEGTSNITGVLEYEHIPESIRLLQNLVPDVRRLAVITDTASHWAPVIQRIHGSMSALPGIELVAVDVVVSYADFQKHVIDYEQTADAVMYLGVFNFLDEEGNTVPYEALQRWVVENSTRPDISFWIDRIHFGVLASVTVSELEQGIAAGKLARTILIDGVLPADIPPEPTVKGRPAINLARARQLGINVQSTELLTSEIIMEFQWERLHD
ncbi:hypothetical protein CKO35_12530 [Ectothiorhodospira shaposhnikovii]|uniref:ABC transporter substrate-binding protein n=1 Tax=Ectothiorhodospira shaposhnikovii TaxID=1054 RepID=UPI001908ECA6|nr:ABC transporter substrate binding protein [Ectothiorhodospira shaposhnikovii]MBK1674113.1 hypothetical protein [Ectothiorhodospira shaposhnikovii]